MNLTELLVGIAILVGLVGIVLPIVPGSILILSAILVWATEDGSRTAWIVFSVATVLLMSGAIVKYTIPGRSLKATGVPNRSLLAGGLLGVVGFFVIPVVGLLIGFVLGIYLSERHRVGADPAWPSTQAALKAVGVSILIELAAALLATTAWIAGAVLT